MIGYVTRSAPRISFELHANVVKYQHWSDRPNNNEKPVPKRPRKDYAPFGSKKSGVAFEDLRPDERTDLELMARKFWEHLAPDIDTHET